MFGFIENVGRKVIKISYLILITNHVFHKEEPYFFSSSIFDILSFVFCLCGPRISTQCVSHSMAKLDFNLKNDFYLLKRNDLESPLIFVLFLKGKQNKKEKP